MIALQGFFYLMDILLHHYNWNYAKRIISLAIIKILVLYTDSIPNIFYPDNVESASAAIQNLMLKAAGSADID